MTPVCEHEFGNSSAAMFPIGSRLAENGRSALHVLTLTPFYPSTDDEAAGCFIAEPLPWVNLNGIKPTVLAVRPFYRGHARTNAHFHPAAWTRYLALPRGIGLATSGRLLVARIRKAVRRLHARDPLTLIHAHAALPCGQAALLLARELSIPYVVSVHGCDAFSSRQVGGFAGDWCRRISQCVYRSANKVICISQRVRDEVTEGVQCPASIVYNGVDTDVFYPAPVNHGVPIVLSIGNLIPTKGHTVLLRAIALVSDSHPKLRCQIIGTGPEHRRLSNLASDLGIANRVEFLGRQSREGVAEALRRCTVFALPSAYEGLGCVYLEAMATAKPTIACLGQGIGEIIETGKNGLLVQPNNSRALAQALHATLSDAPLRSRLGTLARRTVVEKFTLAHQAEHLARIYQECAP
jgi:teichuronic acid biosynthesis glycosyltransferase TuaC